MFQTEIGSRWADTSRKGISWEAPAPRDGAALCLIPTLLGRCGLERSIPLKTRAGCCASCPADLAWVREVSECQCFWARSGALAGQGEAVALFLITELHLHPLLQSGPLEALRDAPPLLLRDLGHHEGGREQSTKRLGSSNRLLCVCRQVPVAL